MQNLPSDLEKFSSECPACNGTGMYNKSRDYNNPEPQVGDECESCWGTGINNPHLSHSVAVDLAHRCAVDENYIK